MPPRTRLLATLGALLTGLLIGLWNRGATPSTSTGAIRTWVADRSGGAVVGLDADLLVAARAPVPWPVALAPRAGGGLWVASALEGDPRGAHALLALDSQGRRVEGPHALGPVLDLEPAGDGAAVLLEAGGLGTGTPRERAPPSLLLAAAGAPPRLLATVDGAQCAAWSGGEVLVARIGGRLLLLDGRSGAPRGMGARVVAPGDVVPGAGGEGWWVLDLEHGGRLLRLARDLGIAFEFPLEFGPACLAPHAHEERVWLASADEPYAVRLGPGGTSELVLGELPLVGFSAVLWDRDGGVLLAAPGAVLRYDRSGRALPAQGGFGYLVDLCPELEGGRLPVLTE